MKRLFPNGLHSKSGFLAATNTRTTMKNHPLHYAGIPVVAALVMTCGSVHGQTSKFTYQGKLSDGGVPANGSYEIKFGLADALSGGSVFSTLTKDPVTVSDGVFTVELDYGTAPFIGFNRWIEISVRPSGSADPFEVLSPRQPLTSTPYAMHAGSVNASGLIGQVTDANLAATFSSPRSFTSPSNIFHGSGANLTALNATNLSTGTLADGRLSSNVALLNRSPQAFTGFTNSFSGNLGIGTPTPGGRLHVRGGGLSDDGKLIAETTGGDFGPQLRLKHSGAGGEDWVLVSNGPINQGGVGNFGIVQASTALSRLFIKGNGNVGLGTENPGSKLVVGGDANASTQQLVLQGSSDPDKQLLIGYNTTDNYGSIQPIEQGVGVKNLVLNRDGGKVGIGAAPDSNNSVLSATSTSPFQLDLGGPGGTTSGKMMRLGYNQTGDFSEIMSVHSGVSFKNLVLLKDGANVGIGNTNPGSKLTVAGTIESTNGGVKFPNGTVQTTAAIGSTTEYLKFGPGSFVSAVGTGQVANDWDRGVRFVSGSSTDQLIAPVHLPVGARILSMTVYINDTVATNLRFEVLKKVNGNFGANSTAFDFTFATSAGYVNQTFTPASPEVINNTQSYALLISASGGSWPLNTSLAVNNVVIAWDRP